MISRDQVALVYKYSREQAHLQEELRDLGNQALLRRLRDVPVRTVAESHMCSWLTRRRCTYRSVPKDNSTDLSTDLEDVHTVSRAMLNSEPEIASAPVSDNQTEDSPSLGQHIGTESIGENGAYIDSVRTRTEVSGQEIEQDTVFIEEELNEMMEENSNLITADSNSLLSGISPDSSAN